MKKLLFKIALPFMISTQLLAIDGLENIDFDLSGHQASRVRIEDNADVTRLQQRLRIQMRLKIGGGWEIIGLAQNGTAYNGGFDTVYATNLDSGYSRVNESFDNFEVRRLFVRKNIARI